MLWKDSFAKSGYQSDYKPSKPVVQRCSSCGHRKRGLNHDEGSHHKAKVKP